MKGHDAISFHDHLVREGPPPKLRIISLGGGVQSSVLSLMAAEGAFGDMPNCAIFADTGWEPKPVYDNVKWLAEVLPFPVHVVTHSPNLLEACEAGTEANGYPGLAPPVFLKGENRDRGMTWRQCTKDFKISPIKKKLRELLEVGPRTRIPSGTVEQWLGISVDEIQRARPSRDKFTRFRWPLIEKELSRKHCRAWFAERYPGRLLPRSACVGCPYHSTREWVEVRKQDPEMWKRTVDLDKSLRSGRNVGLRLPVYLHGRCVPLDQAVDEDEKNLRSRRSLFSSDGLWDEECGGYCGV